MGAVTVVVAVFCAVLFRVNAVPTVQAEPDPIQRLSNLQGLHDVEVAHTRGFDVLQRQNLFAQCDKDQEGIIGKAGIECKTFADITEVASDLFGGTPGAAGMNTSQSAEINKLVSTVIEPLEDIAAVLIDAYSPSDAVRTNNVCFDDFQGSDVTSPAFEIGGNSVFADNKCNNLPLKADVEYTVIAFSFLLPKTSAICPALPTASKGLQVTMCLVASRCPTDSIGLPTVAFGISGDLLGCALHQISAPTVGVGSLLGAGAQATIDFLGAGLSTTNAFNVPVVVFNGRKLFKYNANPTYFEMLKLKVKSETIGLGKWLELSMKVTRGLSIQGATVDELDSGFGSFAADSDSEGDVADVGEQFEDFTVQAFQKGTASLKLKFSELKSLGKGVGVVAKLLPDSPSIELFELNVFVTTGDSKITLSDGTVNEMFKGVYAFAGNSEGSNVIQKFWDYILDVCGSLLDLDPKWIGGGVTSSDLRESVETSAPSPPTSIGDDEDDIEAFGVAFTGNSDRTAVWVNLALPVLSPLIEEMKVLCYTDYSDFDCEVYVDGGLAAAFKAVAEFFEDGVAWIVRTVDDIGEVGEVIGAAFEDFGDELESAFSAKNMKKTGEKILEGLTGNIPDELKAELESWAEYSKMILSPDDIKDAVVKAVNDVGEYGAKLVDALEEEFLSLDDDFLKLAGELEKELNCESGSIGKALSGCTACCSAFENLDETLADAFNDVEEAFQSIWKELSDFGDDVVDFFYSQRKSYEYTDTGKTDENGCALRNIVEVKKTKVLGITVSTKRKTVGQAPDETCLKGRLHSTAGARSLYEKAKAAEDAYKFAQARNLDALTGRNLTSDELDLTCSARWKRDEAVGNSVPLEVVCETATILKNGSLALTPTTVKVSKAIDTSKVAARGTVGKALEDSVRTQLTTEITATMTRPDTGCVAAPGPAGDEADNDCNGVVDNETCDYADGSVVAGKLVFEKDCKCSPPILESMADATVQCDSNYGVGVLGRPSKEVSHEKGCNIDKPSSWMATVDTPVEGKDPDANCGNGQIMRAHQFLDGEKQLSNVVLQTINVKGNAPELDTSLLEETVTESCELAVDEGGLASTVDVPEGLGKSACASSLTTGYEDVDITFAGCKASDKNKGWLVERLWTVEDQCGQSSGFTQTVIRQDNSKPSFSSFPTARLQSCRASTEPATTGFPVAKDNCDPKDTLNPDWALPENQRGGSITYTDTGDLSGCPGSAVRKFLVKDRVCNKRTGVHSIESCAFDFENTGGDYDDSSLLPKFFIKKNSNAGSNTRKKFAKDVVGWINSSGKKKVVKKCQASGNLMILDDKQRKASFIELAEDSLKGSSVMRFTSSSSVPIFVFKPAAFDLLQGYVDQYGTSGTGTFKVPLTCTQSNGIERTGCVSFKMTPKI